MTDLPGLNDNDLDFQFNFDFSSSDAFYEKLRTEAAEELRKNHAVRSIRVGNDRLLHIVQLHAHGMTLDAIGHQLGITRERVRQIERKFWSQISFCKNDFELLEKIVTKILRQKGGFDRLDNIVAKFARHYGWTEREVRYLFSHFFKDLSAKFVFVGEDSEYVSLASYRCWKCPAFKKLVVRTAQKIERRNEAITLEKFAELIQRKIKRCFCRRSGEKKHSCLPKSTPIPTELFAWLLKEDPDLRPFKERMTIHRKSRFPGLNRSVLLVLKLAKRPLSKKEILAELQRMFPKQSLSLRQIQSTTANSPQCSSQIFLWNRGGIRNETLYIHKDYVKTDQPILTTIENALIRIAKQGQVPQIRLNTIFTKYQTECVNQGIPNVYALFSSLKLRGCPHFSFQRTPYIGFEGNLHKISNAKILEGFVKDNGGSVTRQQMRDFGRSLGLKDEHIMNTLALTNLVADLDGYVYRSDEPELTTEFSEMIRRLRTRLAQEEVLTADELYDAERDLCDRLKITDPKMLFSFLRRLDPPGIYMRYPQIQRAGLEKSPRKRKA
ncbi:MAG: hypothetical protein IKE69_12150 [Thermoguttaceae bacterium]|nr:hypothetical protein [Thermoguttaceae bacterium]